MNIFVLYNNPILAARVQHDRHVVKMILESAQMLSAACQTSPLIQQAYERIAKSFPDPTLYKLTHVNHPATQWVIDSSANFVWLTIHMDELLNEYRRRFARAHKCQRLMHLFAAISGFLADNGFYIKGGNALYSDSELGLVHSRVNRAVFDFAGLHSTFVYCGPDSYRTTNIIDSYRAYYLAEKLSGNRWTNHDSFYLPEWLLAANPVVVPPKWIRQPTRVPRRVFREPRPDFSRLASPASVRLGKLSFRKP